MFYSTFKSTENVTAENAKDYAIAELTTELARLDRDIAKGHEFIARQHESIAYEAERYGRTTPDATLTTWISNTEECIAADTKRRLVVSVMLDALTAN